MKFNFIESHFNSHLGDYANKKCVKYLLGVIKMDSETP